MVNFDQNCIVNRLALFLVLCSSISCAPIFVQHDYDKATNFSSYSSYNFDFENSGGLSDLDERRFVKHTDSMLQAQGLNKSDNPNMIIRYNSIDYQLNNQNTLGVGLGGTGTAIGGGISAGIPVGGRQVDQQLVLSIADARNNSIVWEATSDSRLKEKIKPDQRDTHYKKLVEKIFKNFPPNTKTNNN